MSPTFERADRFNRDWKDLDGVLKARFQVAVRELVEDLQSKRTPRPGLRIKRVQGTKNVFEFTFAPDGRATFEWGEEILAGEPHVVWRRIGSHAIFRQP